MRFIADRPVPSRRLSSRLSVCAFAGALLLKSAVPLLAAAAATLQGKAVADICDVYGVATSRVAAAAAATADPGHAHAGHVHSPDGDQPQPASGHGGRAADHCALAGMVAMVGGADAVLARPAPVDAASPAVAAGDAAVFDAVARWAALLEHGPPALS